jgi:putative transposase
MASYYRRLPHILPEGQAVFVTWRLHGTLPISFTKCSTEIAAGRRFAQADRLLDRARFGPKWLANPRVAEIVVQQIRSGEDGRNQYAAHAFCVMPNHVHLLITPLGALSKIMQELKGTTARRANAELRRTGTRFWQDESFDHWVRTPAEFERILEYIEQNPVKAGLTKHCEDWPWSSARFRVLRASETQNPAMDKD